MDNLRADQQILIEALTEVVALLAIVRVFGLDDSGLEQDMKRLVLRLREVTRKIEDGH